MPVDWKKYPKDWKAIAHQVKEEARWCCEDCNRPCRKTGESLFEFIKRIQGFDHPDLNWWNQTAISTICEAPTRFVLTVAHLDHDPTNNDRANLKAKCSGCHLKYDAKHHAKNAAATRRKKAQQNGHLMLLESTDGRA